MVKSVSTHAAEILSVIGNPRRAGLCDWRGFGDTDLGKTGRNQA